jgi:cholesterol oxidase
LKNLGLSAIFKSIRKSASKSLPDYFKIHFVNSWANVVNISIGKAPTPIIQESSHLVSAYSKAIKGVRTSFALGSLRDSFYRKYSGL